VGGNWGEALRSQRYTQRLFFFLLGDPRESGNVEGKWKSEGLLCVTLCFTFCTSVLNTIRGKGQIYELYSVICGKEHVM
jgi:hypothetical protein